LHPRGVQHVAQRVAGCDNQHQDPLHRRCSGCGLVVRTGVFPTRAAPSVITTTPVQRTQEICSCSNKRPARAISTYVLAVTGITKLRSARLNNARSVSIQTTSMHTPATVHGLAKART